MTSPGIKRRARKRYWCCCRLKACHLINEAMAPRHATLAFPPLSNPDIPMSSIVTQPKDQVRSPPVYHDPAGSRSIARYAHQTDRTDRTDPTDPSERPASPVY